MSRCRLFAAVAAGLMLSAAPALAQERGREPEKRPEPTTPAEALKRLQAELERMKAMEAEIQAKMKQLKEAAEKAAAQGGNPFGGDRGGFGGFGGGFGGFGAGNRGGAGPFGGLPVERMSAEQVKELIGQLQKVLEEKTRGEKGDKFGTKPGTKLIEKPDIKPGEKFVKPGSKPGEKPGEKFVKPGTVSNDEILKRLDKLAHEIEEIKKSMKK